MPTLNAIGINGVTYEMSNLNAIKINGVTYEISGSGEKVANGTWTQSTTDRTKITLGFKPKYVAIQASAGSSSTNMIVYNADISITTFKYATSNTYATNLNFGTSTGGALYSIDDDGFTMNKSNSAIALEYMAIG